MSNLTPKAPPRVGEVVSLAPLDRHTRATVLSQTWTPALGEVLRLREDRHGQPSPVIVLYGELLNRVFAPTEVVFPR